METHPDAAVTVDSGGTGGASAPCVHRPPARLWTQGGGRDARGLAQLDARRASARSALLGPVAAFSRMAARTTLQNRKRETDRERIPPRPLLDQVPQQADSKSPESFSRRRRRLDDDSALRLRLQTQLPGDVHKEFREKP